MAVVADKNSSYAKLSGRVGDLVFKQYGDKTVVTRVPDMEHVKPSMLQKHQRSLMTIASPYYRTYIRKEGNREKLEKEMRAAGKRRLFQFYVSKFCSGKIKRVEGKGWVTEDVVGLA